MAFSGWAGEIAGFAGIGCQIEEQIGSRFVVLEVFPVAGSRIAA
jgi:hypothetical protein